MASVRRNILTNTQDRNNFLDGVVALDQEMSGIRAINAFQFLQNNQIPLDMRGVDQDLSTYDLYVFWHIVAMRIFIPPGNAAHGTPVFLPWHRMFLIRLEEQLQRVLRGRNRIVNNDDFGLPYWDWASDGDRPVAQQSQTPLWSNSVLGEARGPVLSGQLADIQVRLWQDPMTGILWSRPPRPLDRQAGLDPSSPALPRRSAVTGALLEQNYDQAPWSQSQFAVGHRNRLEGWLSGPQLHNLVHIWIGGDMGPGTSPNDPVFFLNHCNVDRIWEAWMDGRGDRLYEPGAGAGPAGHRIDDFMVSILGDPLRPQDVLNPSQWYEYDSLIVD